MAINVSGAGLRFSSRAIPLFGVVTPYAHVLVAKRGYTQALRAVTFPSVGWVWIDPWRLWVNVLHGRLGNGSVSSDGGRIEEHCAECQLDSGGPVRLLRRRLVDHINSAKMNGAQDQPDVQASVPADLVSNGAGSGLPIEVYTAHGGGVVRR